tara:strand:+ start:4905 stop:5477 length:573 start_codon:yes stop_codon:yes gene_type:complete
MTNPKIEGILKLLDSHQKLIAMIHAVWCPHCIDLKPKWEEIVKNNPKFNKNVYDIEQKELQDEITSKIGNIGGFPTILSIDEQGNRNEYRGSRDKDAITDWINTELNKSNRKIGKNLPVRKIAKVPSLKKPKKTRKFKKNTRRTQSGGYKYTSSRQRTSSAVNKRKISRSKSRSKSRNKPRSKSTSNSKK